MTANLPSWELLDRHGFEGLRLDDERALVRERLGAYRTFRRTPGSRETDQFPDAGVLVTYGEDDRVTFVELTAPSTPSVRGVALLGRPLANTIRELRDSGLGIVEDADGAVLEGWGVGLYAPTGTVEGVSLGE
jgi:hypothetical protein